MISDRGALLVAVAATTGALHPGRPALGVGMAVGLVWLAARRPIFLAVAVGLVTAGLAQRALDGLDELRTGPVDAEVTLLSDPTPSYGGLRADVRYAGRRLEARADGSARAALEDRLAGEVLRIHGAVSPAPPEATWLLPRHVAGRLQLLSVDAWRPGHPTSRLANGLRRTLAEGTAPLGERQRSLFTGLVIGDDRHQPADLADDFLGAGLTHLLAVSGQNVAFALALTGPLLRRLRLWPRLLATLAVIALFGVMTRFEPSVLRASAMAALAATMAMDGQPRSRVRVIALAVTGLLLVDPLLVRAIGFRLSVAAALAIVVLAPSITRALPGPGWFREALGVTVAAQLGVAPVLLSTFGPIPVASLPANLLAVPIAGLLMVWGLTAGLLAGVAPPIVATVVHVPSRLGLGWLEVVAGRAAGAGLGELRLAHLVALALGLAVAAIVEVGTWRRAGLALAGAALLGALLSAQAPAPLRSSPMPGLVHWHGGRTDVVVLGGAGGGRSVGAAAVLEALRRGGVQTVDLLVVADASVPAAVVEAVAEAHPAGAVIAQGSALLDGAPGAVARVPPGGAVLELGGLTVRLVVVADRLVVDAVPRDP